MIDTHPTDEWKQAVYLAGYFEALYKLAKWQLTAVLEQAERQRRASYDPEAVDYGAMPPTVAELVTRRERVALAEGV